MTSLDNFKPYVYGMNHEFERWLDELSDADLHEKAVIINVRKIARDLGELNRSIGDGGAWSNQMRAAIKRRLKMSDPRPPDNPDRQVFIYP